MSIFLRPQFNENTSEATCVFYACDVTKMDFFTGGFQIQTV